MRIAIGGFLHESHSFVRHPTTYRDFVEPAGFPAFCYGPGLVDKLRDASVPAAGAIATVEARGATIVPLAWGFANPAGPVEDEAFERIAAVNCALLSLALDEGPLDGVYLDLHGAALVDSFPDAEGELLRRVRAIIGENLPLAISLDPHANLTEAMVHLTDIVVPFRTYPHIDMKEAGARAAGLLFDRIGRGKPWAKAWRRLDFWLPLGAQCTLMEPMKPVMSERATIAGNHDVVELAFCFGFPYADFPGCGPALASYAGTMDEADKAADEFLSFVNAREHTFTQELLQSDVAVAEARRLASTATGPIVIADTQDNPGGGGHGDTTELLAELVRQQAKGALLCLINDEASAAKCHAAGEGATILLSLGGKSDGMPYGCLARVERLTDGRFTLTGPMGAGNPGNLGPTALIDVQGIKVIVATRKMQASDQAIIRHVGVEPSSCPVLVLKSSVHFRADFGPIASHIIVAAAPGPVIADPSTLNFQHAPADIRRRPTSKPIV
jgi:microcystin degradation protein MlrC